MCSLIPTTSRAPLLLTRRLQQHGALRRWQSDGIQDPKRVAAELFKPKAAFALPELMWQRKIEDPERPDLALLEQATIQPTVLRQTLSPGSLLLQEDAYNVSELVKMRELMDAKVFWGHKIGTMHPHMQPFIYGRRFDTCIIDLRKTAERMERALNFLAHMAANPDTVILFVSFDRNHMHLIEQAATECDNYAHCRTWQEGTLTRSEYVFGYEIRLPDVIVLPSMMYLQQKEHPAVVEAAKMCIPTVAIVDTNCDPRLITYPIPGNDDSHSAVELYLRLFKTAIQRGRQRDYRVQFEQKTPTETGTKKQSAREVITPRQSNKKQRDAFRNVIEMLNKQYQKENTMKNPTDAEKK